MHTTSEQSVQRELSILQLDLLLSKASPAVLGLTLAYDMYSALLDMYYLYILCISLISRMNEYSLIEHSLVSASLEF